MQSGASAAEPTARRSITAPLVLGVVVLLAHALMLPQFGASWDEPLHRSWGELFAQYLTTGNFDFLSGMAGSGMYYGPTLFTLNWLLSGWMVASFGMPMYEAVHVLNIAIFALSASALYSIARSWFGTRVAVASSLFFVAFPLLVAHAQYNPKDIPLMLCALPVMYYGAALIDRPSRRHALATGLSVGLAFGIKVTALVLVGALALAWLYARLNGSLASASKWPSTAARMRGDLRFVPFVALGTIVGAVVAWPSLVLHPELAAGAIRLFLSPFWPGKVLYFGTVYAAAELPWHYIAAQFVLAMPLITLLCALFGVGTSLLARRARESDGGTRPVPTPPMILLLWIAIPLALSMKPGLVRYDGMRQFFFVVPAIAMFAGLGLDRIGSIVTRPSTRARALHPAALAIAACWLAVEIVRVHPYEGSYLSELGRAALGPDLNASTEMEIWGSSYRDGVNWLNANAKRDAEICAPIAPKLLEWYALRPDLTLGCSPRTRYVMYFLRNTEVDIDRLSTLPPPVFTVTRFNADLLRIHAVEP